MGDAKHILLVDDDEEARAASRLVVSSRCADARLVEVSSAIELVDALVLGGFQVVVVEPAVPWADADALVDCLGRHLPSARIVIFTRDADPFANELAGRPGVSGWVHKEGFSCVMALAEAVESALVAVEDWPRKPREEPPRPGLMQVSRPSLKTSPPPEDPPVTPASEVTIPTPSETGAHPPVTVVEALDPVELKVVAHVDGRSSEREAQRIGQVVDAPGTGPAALRMSGGETAESAASQPGLEDLEALGQLHDMQEPLRTVINYLTVLRERHGEELDGAAPSLVEKAEGAARRMLNGLQQGLPGTRADTPRAIPSRPGRSTGRWRVTTDADAEADETADLPQTADAPVQTDVHPATDHRVEAADGPIGTGVHHVAESHSELQTGSHRAIGTGVHPIEPAARSAEPAMHRATAAAPLSQAVPAAPSVRPEHQVQAPEMELLTESIAMDPGDDVQTLDRARASVDDLEPERGPAPLPEDHTEVGPDVSDPEVAMRATLENLESTISRHGALITWDPLPDTLPLNELQLTQLFQNLLSNAIKFRGRKAPRIHLGVNDVADGFELSVADNGVGMPREAQKRVFRMFERAHGSAFPGTGIGLAICKQIVEGAGGRIWLDSVPGVGTTVRFRVPRVGEKLTVGVKSPTVSD